MKKANMKESRKLEEHERKKDERKKKDMSKEEVEEEKANNVKKPRRRHTTVKRHQASFKKYNLSDLWNLFSDSTKIKCTLG